VKKTFETKSAQTMRIWRAFSRQLNTAFHDMTEEPARRLERLKEAGDKLARVRVFMVKHGHLDASCLEPERLARIRGER